MNEQEIDLFEDLKYKSGCMYVSDMKTEFGRKRAIHAMRVLDLTPYLMFSIQDMADYLFDEKVTFADHAEAHRYFTDHE